MQQPLFNLPHPSIHSGFDDGLPQIPSNLATNAQTHPLNLSNHSDQSKHSHHTMTTNSLSRTTNTPNTTTASYITPPHIPIDGHNTNIEMPTTDVTSFTCNDMLDPDHVFTNPHIEQNDALQIYPSQPLIGDTNTILMRMCVGPTPTSLVLVTRRSSVRGRPCFPCKHNRHHSYPHRLHIRKHVLRHFPSHPIRTRSHPNHTPN
eukprot:406383_1